MITVKEQIVKGFESILRDKTALMIGMNEILALATIGSIMQPELYNPIKTIISKTMKQLENKSLTDFENDTPRTSY